MMPNGEEWYLAPIELGYYTYAELKTTRIQIEDIAEINDGMSASAENRSRMREAMKSRG